MRKVLILFPVAIISTMTTLAVNQYLSARKENYLITFSTIYSGKEKPIVKTYPSPDNKYQAIFAWMAYGRGAIADDVYGCSVFVQNTTEDTKRALRAFSADICDGSLNPLSLKWQHNDCLEIKINKVVQVQQSLRSVFDVKVIYRLSSEADKELNHRNWNEAWLAEEEIGRAARRNDPQNIEDELASRRQLLSYQQHRYNETAVWARQNVDGECSTGNS